MGIQYQNYRVEDFVADQHFQRWVQHPEPSTETFWQQWLSDNPDKISLIEEAREIILQLRTESFEISEDKLNSQLARLDKHLDTWEARQVAIAPTHRLTYRTRWGMAAAVALLAVIGGVFLLAWWPIHVTMATSYGETRSVWLPDSSRVELNGNSKIRYKRHWYQGQTREVWLEGEAFFTVRPQSLPGQKVKFIVHTPDLDVNVLGTRFNVHNRGEQTRIVLNSGKITLRLAEKSTSGNTSHKLSANNEIAMQPGDYVVYSSKQHELVRKKVNPEEYSSWREGQLKFNFTPLSEIARIIEERMGIR